jgi:hypothetical protein
MDGNFGWTKIGERKSDGEAVKSAHPIRDLSGMSPLVALPRLLDATSL